jgi:hypothetical protein
MTLTRTPTHAMNASLRLCTILALTAHVSACGDEQASTRGNDDVARGVRDADFSELSADEDAGQGSDSTTGNDTDTDEGSVDAEADGADTSDLDAESVDGTGADGSGGETDADADATAGEDTGPACGADTWVWSGVLLEDSNGGTLDVGDVVRITVDLLSSETRATPLALHLTHSNIGLRPTSFQLDGAPVTPTIAGSIVTLSRTDSAPATLTYEGTVESSEGLLAVLSVVTDTDTGCDVRRSRSGAFFQITGGETKTPTCIDMLEYRSMQVAPFVAKQNTDAYATLNGVRDDLRADEFIFCPQSPTIVHQTEFCMTRGAGQDVSFAGSFTSDGDWEVDDFILVEVIDGDTITDGFTTQHHTGRPNTFYCGEIDRLMCETDCTAALIDVETGRRITPIADVTAEGDRARLHADGAVSISGLLPASVAPVDVRITALDTGVEGTLTPALYLVSGDP